MTPDELEQRTRTFALRVIRLVDALPTTTSGRAIGNQLVRSATSVAANYRAARRGRSRKEFVAKLGIVVEEADESLFWLELVRDANMMPAAKLAELCAEADTLMRIFAKSRRTAANKATNTTNRQTTKPQNH